MTLRIACVGDSITRGTFVWGRKHNSYPAQLQQFLGERYCVRGFGVNGHAAQQTADRPYRSSRAFVASSAFEPNIVLVMLGTNDARGDNWKGVDAFYADYRALVNHYLSLDSTPNVWLLTPPTLFKLGRSSSVRYGMSEAAIGEISSAVRRIGPELGCRVIDINEVTAAHPEAFRFDGVHPGAAGATLIARAVADALTHGMTTTAE